MMRDAILQFAEQFTFEPKIEHADALAEYARFVVIGMGGSHLAADILAGAHPELDITVLSDYGLPKRLQGSKDTLCIVSSYSGNTEESLDAYQNAGACGLPRAVITVGGRLMERAHQDSVPWIRLPDTGIQPRSALGFSAKALLKMMRQERALTDITSLAATLKPAAYEDEGGTLAAKLNGRIPVIYASTRNRAVAYIWKIKLNETGKIPAFYNVIPELNHNEMNGFDVADTTRSLSDRFTFLLLTDEADHPANQKRMDVVARLYRDRSLPVIHLPLRGATPYEKIFSSIILADWTSYYIAEQYGVESEQVPLVEELKRLIAA